MKLYMRKSLVQYLPVLLVFGLILASFLDYNFNYLLTLFFDGHILQGIIYAIIYNGLLVLFVSSYIMVTFTDPGCPTKDVVNVLSGNELASFYTTLEELPEYKKMTESTSSETSHQSTGALLKDDKLFDHNLSSSTINPQGIPLNPLPSSSNSHLAKGESNETLIEPLNTPLPPISEEGPHTIINLDTYAINENKNSDNVVFNRGNNINTKKDQISIDIDNDKILERNINKLYSNNETTNNDHQSYDSKPSTEEVNNIVCKKCLGFKPERTHHCSICKRCILKMDHHCPWLSNCVGFYNYKFFMLFLFYGSIYIIFQCITIFITFIFSVQLSNDFIEDLLYIDNLKKLWIIHIFMSFVLGMAIFIFFITHVTQNLLSNATTLELFDKQRRIQNYRFKILRERRKRELEKLEDEVKELESEIASSPLSTDVYEKKKVLKKKQDKLQSKTKEFNHPRNRSPKFVSESPRNIPKSVLHNPYNLGKKENFYQVFGRDPKLWFIPVPSSLGDGYHYPKYEFIG